MHGVEKYENYSNNACNTCESYAEVLRQRMKRQTSSDWTRIWVEVNQHIPVSLSARQLSLPFTGLRRVGQLIVAVVLADDAMLLNVVLAAAPMLLWLW